MDWRYGTKDHDISSGETDVKKDFLSVIAGDSISRMTQIPGIQASAIIGDEGRFVARLNVLEREGFVKVASRPKSSDTQRSRSRAGKQSQCVMCQCKAPMT